MTGFCSPATDMFTVGTAWTHLAMQAVLDTEEADLSGGGQVFEIKG